MSGRRVLSLGVSVVLGCSLVWGAPAAAAVVAGGEPPVVAPPVSVPVSPVETRSPSGPVSVSPPDVVAPAVWPVAGSAVIVVPGAGPEAAGAPDVGGDGRGEPGGLPVVVRPADPGEVLEEPVSPLRRSALLDDPLTPEQVLVSVAAQSVAEAAGVYGVVFRVSRNDGGSSPGVVDLDLDYREFAAAYGADFGARLVTVSLPECVLDTPAVEACQVQTEVVSTNRQVDLVVSVPGLVVAPNANPGSGGVYAVTSGTSSPSGTFTATSLAASYEWSAGNQGGDFGWSYPIRTPPVPGGLVPPVTVTYSSGGVDGRTLSTNSQPSWVGEGFDLGVGYVERTYKSCRDDGQTIDDLCFWNPNEATLVLGGRAVRLVRDPVADNWFEKVSTGLRVRRLTGPWGANQVDAGEHWQVTTQDGTEYWFGTDVASTQGVIVFGDDVGEPCHLATLSASYCGMGYRWNLRKVVDPRGNLIEYFYFEEQNKYGRYRNSAGAQYDMEGVPVRIDYGYRAGGQPSARVVLERGQRCVNQPCDVNTVAGRANWFDTPWDLNCSVLLTNCPGRYAPSFWSRNRLVSVTTQARNAGGGYDDVDRWALTHVFPGTWDNTSMALWFNTLTHTGLVGGVPLADPAIGFGGTRLPNRVDTSSSAATMNKYRLVAVNNGAGGVTNVAYSVAQCSASSYPAGNAHNNTLRCFPQYFGAGFGWFHKYVVGTVSQQDLTGGSPTEYFNYFYSTGGTDTSVLWAYDQNGAVPEARRSWSQWRGYSAVTTWHGGTAGSITATDKLFHRGLDGDRANPAGQTRVVRLADSQSGGFTLGDHRSLQGILREETTRTGTGASVVASSTIHDQTVIGTYSYLAHRVHEIRARTRTWLAHSSSYRWRDVQTTVDGYGLPTLVKDLGDMGVATDDVCTSITYARDAAAFKANYPAQSTVTNCAASPTGGDFLGGSQILYDGTTVVGAAPTQGLPTKTLSLATASGTTLTWAQTSRATYDAHGRPLVVFDALDRGTTTGYTPASGGPVTAVTTTNPLGHVVATTLDRGRGLPTLVVDPNNKATTAAYDPSGRLLKVWLPGRPTNQTPNVEYAYLQRSTGANAVTTRQLGPNGAQIVSHALFDGLFRARQTQTVAPDGKRVIADTGYDDRGLAVKTSAFYNNASGPTDVLVSFADTAVDRQTATLYDLLERPTTGIAKTAGVELWRTTTGYDGDRTSVTPPAGGTASMSIVDARGRMVELRQYQAATPTGVFDATTYLYDRLDRLVKVTDPVGNHWDYTFDLRGRQVTAVDPDAGTSGRTYDDAGQVLTTTDARGEVIANVHDVLGRVVERRDDTPTGALRASWVFDTIAKGQLTSSTRRNGAVTYTSAVTGYNDTYQPTSGQVTIPAAETGLAGTYTFGATYNVDGSVATQSLPAAGGLPAETITTVYSAQGLPATVTGLSTYLGAVSYDWDGAVTQQTLGSGTNRVQLTTDLDDATGRLSKTQVHTEHPGTPNTWDEVVTEQYRFNNAGTLKSLVEQHNTVTTSAQCFGYDYLQRLTEAWTNAAWNCGTAPSAVSNRGPDPYWTTWTFDKTGNRLSQVAHATSGGADATTTYTHPAAGGPKPHTLTSTSGAGGSGTYGYDAVGNTTTRNVAGTTQTLTWDPEGHLATHVVNGQTYTYLYDADGSRLIRRDPTGATLYLPGGTELRHTTGSGTTCTRYYPSAVRTTTGLTWTAGDHHGTQQTAINATTLSANRRLTKPYGETRGTPPATWPGEHGYLNAPADPTGLTHLGAREYDPGAGRFISVDPLIDPNDPQQMHGYAYSNSNPTTMSDPDGLCVRLDDDSAPCIGSQNYGQRQREFEQEKQGTSRPSYPDRPTVETTQTGREKIWIPMLGMTQDQIDARSRVMNLLNIYIALAQFSSGAGTRIQNFYQVDEMTRALRLSSHLVTVRSELAALIAAGDYKPSDNRDYDLPDGDDDAVASRVAADAIAGLAGVFGDEEDRMRATVALVGSFKLAYEVTAVDSASRRAVIAFSASNIWNVASATRDPFATRPTANPASGPNRTAEPVQRRTSGPVSPVVQNWYWVEVINF